MVFAGGDAHIQSALPVILYVSNSVQIPGQRRQEFEGKLGANLMMMKK